MQNPTHTYDNAGSYTATVTVTGDEGATTSDSVIIVVEEETVSLTFSIHDAVTVNLADYDDAIPGVELSGILTVEEFWASDVVVVLSRPVGHDVRIFENENVNLNTLTTVSLTIPAGTYDDVCVTTTGGYADVTWSGLSVTISGYPVTIPGIGASGSWVGSIPSGTWCVKFPPISITSDVTIDLDTGVPAPTTVTTNAFTGWEFDNRDVTVTRDAAVIYP